MLTTMVRIPNSLEGRVRLFQKMSRGSGARVVSQLSVSLVLTVWAEMCYEQWATKAIIRRHPCQHERMKDSIYRIPTTELISSNVTNPTLGGEDPRQAPLLNRFVMDFEDLCSDQSCQHSSRINPRVKVALLAFSCLVGRRRDVLSLVFLLCSSIVRLFSNVASIAFHTHLSRSTTASMTYHHGIKANAVEHLCFRNAQQLWDPSEEGGRQGWFQW